MDLLGLPFSGLSSWFGRAAVAVWWWGSPPSDRSGPGGRSAVSETYRVVYRTGQVIGWLTIAPVLLAIVWRVYA